MANITICSVCLSMVVFHQNQIIYFWVIMLIVANNHWKQFVFCSHIKLNIRKIFSYWGVITNVHQLIAFMVFMMNARDDTILNCGKHSLIVLIVCRWRRSLMRRSFVVMEVSAKKIWKFYYMNVYVVVGLSPDLQSMEQIRRIMRPTDVPDQGLLCDLLWSDPDKDTTGWGENDRGVSFTFGAEVITFLFFFNLIIRKCNLHI